MARILIVDDDEEITEIMVNGPSTIFIEQKGKLTLSNRQFTDEKQLRVVIDRIVAGKGVAEDIDRLYAISEANDGTTICGMGDAAGYATIGILNKYRDEFEHFITHGSSKCDGRLECLA